MGLRDWFDRDFAAKKAPSNVPKGESGHEGDEYVDSMIDGGGDINPRLKGRQKFDVYHEMVMTDAAVKATLLMYTLQIRAADWSFEPHSDDPLDALVAAACAAQFGLEQNDGWINLSWDEQLIQALRYLRDGSFWEELVWGDDLIEWAPPAKLELSMSEPRRYRPIVKLGPRYARTIDDIDIDQKSGHPKRIHQDVNNGGWIQSWVKDTRKLSWYIHEKEGISWHGVSMLRPMYGPWRLKKALMLAAGIGYDRYAAGVPIVRYPEGGGEDAKQKADAIGRNIRVHERAWVTLEGAAPPHGQWDVDVLNGSSSIADPTPLLRYYDEQIAKASLQGFSNLGTSQTGSRAVAEVLDDPYYAAVEAIAYYVASQKRQQQVRAFVDVNFGKDVPTPQFAISGIERDNTMNVIDAIGTLSAAQWNMTDRELHNYVRTRLSIPLLPEDEDPKAEGMGLAAPGVPPKPTPGARATPAKKPPVKKKPTSGA